MTAKGINAASTDKTSDGDSRERIGVDNAVDACRKSEIELAKYEIDTLRQELDLTTGEAGIPQLGGSHGKVKGQLVGFESHHIPARSVLNADANDLPAIALTKEDHKLTDSYAGKQGHRHVSFLPDVPPSDTYKQEVIEEISKGGFFRIVRNEIYNIKDKFGNKYDGALQKYLDALEEYIEKHGIPKIK